MTVSSLFQDTIFALSSGGLPSGVAVIRLSGPHVPDVLKRLTGGVPVPRRAELRNISDPGNGLLDRGLVIFFEGPASFTGEDCAELQVHGGRAVVSAILNVLAAMPGLRHAEAGDFTRRAFLNGKLDLTGAEALADLISSETEFQRRLALQNADGKLKEQYQAWGQRLLHARAMIEAELDFSDEADVPGSVSDLVWADMAGMQAELDLHIKSYRTAEIIREGFRVVLVGVPNAGKSSLLNALAKRDVAIVTEVPGTTRDLVQVVLDLNGAKVIVTDTAGIRDSADIVERIGIDRALDAAERADLVLHLVEPEGDNLALDRISAPTFLVGTKSDVESEGYETTVDFRISSKTGDGLGSLIEAISASAYEQINRTPNQIAPFRARQVSLLAECRTHLLNAIERTHAGLELRAEELRLAATALERITGETDVEDLLGVIFSEFCIGK